MKKIILVVLFVLLCPLAMAKTVAQTSAENNPSAEHEAWNYTDFHPWSLLFYVGRTAKEPIGRVIRGKFTSVNETLYTTELAYTLSRSNIVRKFFSPVVSEVQLAGNVTVRDGKYNKGKIYEFDPYIIFRWTHFPWNNYLLTTFGAAEGVSYATHVPWVEKRYNHDCARFLNYLMFELTFALPQYPQFQIVARIHHRSGGYGLYGAGNTGSNTAGVGVRYYF